jgi:hypothetical protein
MTPTPQPPAWRRGLSRNVVILGVVSLLNDAASEMIYPLLPAFLTSVLGAGPAALGMIEGVAESTASFLKLYSGYVSDRMKRRKTWIVAGYAISNIIRPLIAVAGSWVQVLALRFSDRVGKGLRTSPRDALIADSTAPEARGAAYGFHRALDHGGAIVGPLLATGLLVLFHDNIPTIFLLSFIPGTRRCCCSSPASASGSRRTPAGARPPSMSGPRGAGCRAASGAISSSSCCSRSATPPTRSCW